jgi:hypothetical protein
MRLEYKKNKRVIESFYSNKGLVNEFRNDNIYLESAFNEINNMWIENLRNIDEVKYLLIAEAPLWGQNKKYIYNPRTNNSQFFFRSDLETILNIQITSKKEFIRTCKNIGLLVVDISPFPLNTKDTRINYSKNTVGSKKLTKKEYIDLVKLTIPAYFERKIRLVEQKKSPNIKVFFRYTRVKDAFQDIISDVLIKNGLIIRQEEIGEISQTGGGIDKLKLKKILG